MSAPSGIEQYSSFRTATLRRLRGGTAPAARPVAVLVLDVAERESITEHFGPSAARQAVAELAASLVERVGRGHVELNDDDRATVVIELDEDLHRWNIDDAVQALSAAIAATPMAFGSSKHVVTPVVGAVQAAASADEDLATLQRRADLAANTAGDILDLRPVWWSPELEAPAKAAPAAAWRVALERFRLPLQIVLSLLLAMVVPYALYVRLADAGFDITGFAYFAVVIAMVITALFIWGEAISALDPQRPPATPAAPAPRASAIIAAYLPNEQDVIQDTIQAFLDVDYPDLQIILAYNTPEPLAVEAELLDLAGREPRLQVMKVAGSSSKAQNVNAALSLVEGEFVGVFDADHRPDRNAFHRAWRWLSNGWDVVQGHCVVRNGEDSLVARTVAVEFEVIYGVSHPGRAQMHGFGVFGGSNGFWRTEQLRAIRMQGQMLTEDIDSSLRTTLAGGRVANDPGLVSRELAPTTLKALWGQRLRWAQGWTQVSRRHLLTALRSPWLNSRQKLGMGFLLGWRELNPWLSVQMIPLLAFAIHTGVSQWFTSLLVATTLFTLSVGPAQVLVAWRLAEPSVRQRGWWFLSYLLVSGLVYTEMKNLIARVAHIKELSGERAWKVTPRSVPSTAGASG